MHNILRFSLTVTSMKITIYNDRCNEEGTNTTKKAEIQFKKTLENSSSTWSSLSDNDSRNNCFTDKQHFISDDKLHVRVLWSTAPKQNKEICSNGTTTIHRQSYIGQCLMLVSLWLALSKIFTFLFGLVWNSCIYLEIRNQNNLNHLLRLLATFWVRTSDIASTDY